MRGSNAPPLIQSDSDSETHPFGGEVVHPISRYTRDHERHLRRVSFLGGYILEREKVCLWRYMCAIYIVAREGGEQRWRCRPVIFPWPRACAWRCNFQRDQFQIETAGTRTSRIPGVADQFQSVFSPSSYPQPGLKGAAIGRLPWRNPLVPVGDTSRD